MANRCCCGCKACGNTGNLSQYNVLCAYVRETAGNYFDNWISNYSFDLLQYHVYRLTRAPTTFPWGQSGACWMYQGSPARIFYPPGLGPRVTIAFGCMKNYERFRVQVFFENPPYTISPPYTGDTGIDSENRLSVHPYAPAGSYTQLTSCVPPHVEFFVKEYAYISDPTVPVQPYRDWKIRIGPYPPDFTVSP